MDPFVGVEVVVLEALGQPDVALPNEVMFSEVEVTEDWEPLGCNDDETEEEEAEEVDGADEVVATPEVDVGDDCDVELDEGMTTEG
jgi:hypothetical protein